MRIVAYIEHPIYKITIMEMNHRFSIKFEDQGIEQTYKIRASQNISNAADVKSLVTEEILLDVTQHFKSLNSTRTKMLGLVENQPDEFEEII